MDKKEAKGEPIRKDWGRTNPNREPSSPPVNKG